MTDAADLDPEYSIRSESALRALFPDTHEMALRKCLDRIDAHARAFIERAPFLCIGTQSADGRADVSPRGDPPGFVWILNDRTLLIPDRPGNNRLDTLSNIVAQPKVGLLFLVPGFDDTLRINGTAELTRDPRVLGAMAVNGRVPTIAIAVHVEEVFLHCAKALRRSRLWDAERHQDRRALPSLVRMILDQTGDAPADPAEQKRLDDALEEDYRQSMY